MNKKFGAVNADARERKIVSANSTDSDGAPLIAPFPAQGRDLGILA